MELPEVLEQVKLLVGKNQKTEALMLLEKAVQQWPDKPVLLLWYAGLTPNLERGIRALERVLELDPGNIAAQKGLEDLRQKRAASLQSSISQPSNSLSTPSPSLEPSSVPSRQAIPEEKAPPKTPSAAPDLVAIAGETFWPFRNLKGSIQELVESHKVTSRDLLWAAQNAQQPHLRWAAAVYLRREQLAQIGLTHSDLETVTWPFRNINRPILQAVQTGQVKIDDLIYAVLNARDTRLLQGAALAGYLLLHGNFSMESSPPVKSETASRSSTHSTISSQEGAKSAAPPGKVTPTQSPREHREAHAAPSQGQLQVIEGSPYLRAQREALRQKTQLTRTLSLGLIFLALLSGIVISLFLPRLSIISWLLLGLAGFLVKIKEIFRKQEENLGQGIAGEEAFVAELRKHLNSDWKLFRNIDLPDRSGDLDAVLVGPKGIYLFEIKAYNVTCRNQGERWEYRAWGKWKPLSRNPTQQALRNAARLNEHLKEFLGQDTWVEPRIVWAGKSKLYLDKPRVKIWYLRQQEYWLKEIQNGKALPPEKLSQIVVSLRTLCAVNRSGM